MKQKFYSAFWLKHLGVYYMLVASFYFALNGALAKVMAERMSSAEIVFFRNVVGIGIVLFSLKRVKNLGPGGKRLYGGAGCRALPGAKSLRTVIKSAADTFVSFQLTVR